MATRRNVTQTPQTFEKTLSEAQGGPPSSTIRSDTRPAVPMNVLTKLLLFTFAMAVFPIGSYFVTLNVLFGGNATYAGAFAAIMANVVLVGYIIVAVKEDQEDQQSVTAGVNAIKAKVDGKKSQ